MTKARSTSSCACRAAASSSRWPWRGCASHKPMTTRRPSFWASSSTQTSRSRYTRTTFAPAAASWRRAAGPPSKAAPSQRGGGSAAWQGEAASSQNACSRMTRDCRRGKSLALTPRPPFRQRPLARPPPSLVAERSRPGPAGPSRGRPRAPPVPEYIDVYAVRVVQIARCVALHALHAVLPDDGLSLTIPRDHPVLQVIHDQYVARVGQFAGNGRMVQGAFALGLEVFPGGLAGGRVEDHHATRFGKIGNDHLLAVHRGKAVGRVAHMRRAHAPRHLALAGDARYPGAGDLGDQDVSVLHGRGAVGPGELLGRVVLAPAGFAPLGGDLVGLGVDDQHAAVADIGSEELAVGQQVRIVGVVQQTTLGPAPVRDAPGPGDRFLFAIDNVQVEIVFLTDRQLPAIRREVHVFVAAVVTEVG